MKFAEKAKRMVRAGTLLFMFILTFGMITTYADGFFNIKSDDYGEKDGRSVYSSVYGE